MSSYTPQNGECIVTKDSVTSFHLMYGRTPCMTASGHNWTGTDGDAADSEAVVA